MLDELVVFGLVCVAMPAQLGPNESQRRNIHALTVHNLPSKQVSSRNETHRGRVLRSHSSNDVAAQVRLAFHAEHDRPHIRYLLERVTL